MHRPSPWSCGTRASRRVATPWAIVIVLLVLSASAQAALVSHYSFEGDALDPVGGRNGTLVNAPGFTTGAPGGGAQALNLPNGNDMVTVDIQGADTLAGNYTVSLWANPANGGAFGTFIGTRGGSDQSFDAKFQNDVQIHGDIGTGGTWLNTGVDANNIDYKSNVWTHVTYAVGPGNANIYANGILVASHNYGAGTPLFFDATHDIAIGGDRATNPASENFNGAVDEVKLFNTKLTSAEVLAALAPAGHVRVPTFFSTGLDIAGNPLAAGANDPHYDIVSPAGPDQAIPQDGFPIPPWVGNDAQSQWLSPATDNDGNAGVGNFTYRTVFDLSGFDPDTAFITGLWATDNNAVDILINGVSVGAGQLPSDAGGTASFGHWTPFNITTGFVAGLNTVDFVLNNQGGPTGLRVAGNAFAAQSIPEPATGLLGLMGIALLGLRRKRVA